MMNTYFDFSYCFAIEYFLLYARFHKIIENE